MIDGINLVLTYKSDNKVVVSSSDKEEDYIYFDKLLVSSFPIEEDDENFGVQLMLTNGDDDICYGIKGEASRCFLTLSVQEAEVLMLALKQEVEICKEINLKKKIEQ